MNKTEARNLLSDFLLGLQQKPYLELAELIANSTCIELGGAAGTKYQVEVLAVWDSKPNGALRVIASIDDGGSLSSLAPMTLDFLTDSRGNVLA